MTAVDFYTLRNRHGTEVRASDYGATILSIRVRDREGNFDDVVLGFDSIDDYRRHTWYCGATVGRYAGRISEARFTIDGRTYTLAANDGAHHLHGGANGFDKVLWRGHRVDDSEARFHYISADGEEGYPGEATVQVSYALTGDDELIVDYHATSDRATPLNLTHHSYFNLAGAGSGDVLNHELQIFADHFLPVNDALIPTSELRSVAGTPFDFRESTRIGARIAEADEQLQSARGYDHDFVLRANVSGAIRCAARMYEPTSGRVLEVFTTQPALHVYTGNWLGGEPLGRGAIMYGRYSGVALEAQHFADSPNQPRFPSTLLVPGAQYHERTIYRFSLVA